MNRYFLPMLVGLAFAAGVTIAAIPGRERKGSAKRSGKRVVALSTAAVEIIFALGAEDSLVGVTDYAVYPPAAVAIENCGGWANTNFEVITGLNPDLIIVQGRHETVRKFAARRSIPVISLNSSSIEDVFDDIGRMGVALGVQDSAEKLKSRIRDGLSAVSRAVAGKPVVPVLIVTGRMVGTIRQISTCGGDSFLSRLTEIAGGKNIFSDTKGYITISREELLARSPEVIIELRPGEKLDDARIEGIKAEYRKLQSLPAVRDGRIHIVLDPSALTAGPRIHQVAAMIAELLHPEIELSGNKRVGDSDR